MNKCKNCGSGCIGESPEKCSNCDHVISKLISDVAENPVTEGEENNLACVNCKEHGLGKKDKMRNCFIKVSKKEDEEGLTMQELYDSTPETIDSIFWGSKEN